MSSKFALTAALSLLLALILACGGAAPAEQVIVEKEVVTEREVVKEVPRDVIVEKEVVREVVKEVPVVKEVLRDAPSKPDPRPGRISWTSGQSLASPDSHVWAVGGDGQIFRNTFEGITQELGYGVAGPALAEDWTLASDNVTWTFNLRTDAEFHNGDAVTAEDVRFSILRLRDSPTGNLKLQARHVEDVTVVDPDTIQLVTKAPSPTNLIFIRCGQSV
jgi:ABC-type transport system substrate-binding protein